MITQMMVNVRAARLLCAQAGRLKVSGDPTAVIETWVAKYFASTIATQAASNAVQIHGAYGCHDSSPVQRYWRDGRLMEIIGGSTQIQEIVIAGFASQG